MTFSSQLAANNNSNEKLVAIVAKAIREAVDAEVGADAEFRSREASALAVANEAVRQFLETDLQLISDRFDDDVVIDGRLYRRHAPGTVAYHSLCGPLHVQRWTYRLVGKRNGPTRIPMELAAGIAERATPALAYCVAHGYAKAPTRSVEGDLRAAHRKPPSRSTLERIAKALGTDAKAVAARIEQRLRSAEQLPEGAVAISLGLDRTTIPMEEDRTAEETARKKPRRRKPRLRKKPAPVCVHYRMGYIGTVSVTDKRGEVLVTRRYAAPASDGASRLLDRMMADLNHALTQKPHLHVGVVQDNAPELWNLMRGALQAQPLVKKHHEIVDRYHFMEHLAAALEIVEPNPARRVKQLEKWRCALDKSDHAIHGIRRFFEIDLLERDHRKFRDTETMSKIDRALGNYVVRWEHFQYASVAQLGLPTGSGITEGACKSLISARAKRSGQRWRPDGISAVLTLRSLLESDRLPRFWNIFSMRYTAHCEAA